MSQKHNTITEREEITKFLWGWFLPKEAVLHTEVERLRKHIDDLVSLWCAEGGRPGEAEGRKNDPKIDDEPHKKRGVSVSEMRKRGGGKHGRTCIARLQTLLCRRGPTKIVP
jgi:hypothetical protein